MELEQQIRYEEFGATTIRDVLLQATKWVSLNVPYVEVEDITIHTAGKLGWLIRIYYRRWLTPQQHNPEQTR